jgi:hypothetical protein
MEWNGARKGLIGSAKGLGYRVDLVHEVGRESESPGRLPPLRSPLVARQLRDHVSNRNYGLGLTSPNLAASSVASIAARISTLRAVKRSRSSIDRPPKSRLPSLQARMRSGDYLDRGLQRRFPAHDPSTQQAGATQPSTSSLASAVPNSTALCGVRFIGLLSARSR